MTRRTPTRALIPLVAGILATLVGLLAGDAVRQYACGGGGGRWQAAARSCLLPPGVEEPVLAGPAAYLLAVPVGAATVLVLWRTFTFFATGRHRRPHPPA